MKESVNIRIEVLALLALLLTACANGGDGQYDWTVDSDPSYSYAEAQTSFVGTWNLEGRQLGEGHMLVTSQREAQMINVPCAALMRLAAEKADDGRWWADAEAANGILNVSMQRIGYTASSIYYNMVCARQSFEATVGGQCREVLVTYGNENVCVVNQDAMTCAVQIGVRSIQLGTENQAQLVIFEPELQLTFAGVVN